MSCKANITESISFITIKERIYHSTNSIVVLLSIGFLVQVQAQ